MDKKSLILGASCSVALGWVISYADSGISPLYMAIDIVMSACAVAILNTLYGMSASLRQSSLRADDFMNASGRISYYRKSGIPVVSAMERAAKSCISNNSTAILRHAVIRMGLGEDLPKAVDSASLPERRIHDLLEPYTNQHDVDFGAAFSSYKLHQNERDAENSSAMLRYSTVNMFISTVAPSFIIFSFIGNMLISPGSASIGGMSLLLIIALPIMYALSSSSLSRRLYG
ncbi:MAG: hypothetical protein M1569_02970 [Candidatus Marsarchaeota archaeon]|nr:hypothetical protein [Candidatus Marsarchaeota archaeon]MCL5413339.1 hypothetical protein [Candidatus Marsarchaeota archaeon]